ncbi:MAG: DUF2339 domain-containing protein [Acidobacteria bacterium]|nr:DUF2339 domain-containing protein [Acidobacteriota bacterium]
MEGFFVLVASLIGLAFLAVPIVSLIGFVRSRAMRRQLDELQRTVEALERRVGELAKRGPAPGPQAAPVVTAAPPVPAASTARATPQPPAAPLRTPPAPPPPPAPRPTPPPMPPPHVEAPPAPPAPPAPAFDWESMLGVRGAAWMGGITLDIAAAFFAKWSIDPGFFSPAIRIALMQLAGTGALVWAELKLRAGFQTTANSVSGAGVVTLYLAFFAAHSLYQLVGLTVTFAAMSLVTVVAAVIAVRHAALFTAVIGLVGGLATPVLLSTGVDRPLAFFSYLFVLAIGFLHVAERRQWPVITMVSLAGTTLLQFGWYQTYLAPEKLLVAMGAFAAIGGAYLWHALRVSQAKDPLAYLVSIGGALVPLVFITAVAADPRFGAQWLLVLADLAVVGAALAWVGARRTQPVLVGASALATGLALALLGAALEPSPDRWGLAAVAVVIVAGYTALPRLAARAAVGWLAEPEPLAGIVGFAPLAGLFALAWTLVPGEPSTWLFLGLLAALFAALVERTRERQWPGALAAGSLLLALMCARWFTVMASPGGYLGHLAIPHLLAVAVAILVLRRDLAEPREAPSEWWRREELSVLAAAGVAGLSLFVCADRTAFSAPAPLFALLALDVALALIVTLRTGWTELVPAAAAAAVAFMAVWHTQFSPAVALPAATAYLCFYAGFVGLPFVVVRRLAPSWTSAPLPWLTAALIGPAMFLLFYDAWAQVWGKAWIGVVPVLMATVSVAALYGVSRHFAPADGPGATRRLNYLALFAAIALGFVAAALPVQVNRQWITLGWALEAAAVWWLFGRLPHPGLKYFGLALFSAVGVRLLVNPAVLRYEPRGAAVINWLLYTYGVPALACLVGAMWLRRAEARRGESPRFDYLARDRDFPAAVVAFLGLLLVFWLINLEIADYYSAGRYVELDLTRHLQRDLTRSFAWGLYAITLLVVGLWKRQRGLRLVSLGFLMLTVGKVFLYDLGQLTGLYRIVSFMALGVSLILVSLLYQRFARREESPA